MKFTVFLSELRKYCHVSKTEKGYTKVCIHLESSELNCPSEKYLMLLRLHIQLEAEDVNSNYVSVPHLYKCAFR